MSKKRMLSPKIVSSDVFLSMPLSTQALYLHLNLEADDDGFVDNAHSIIRKINASIDDLKLLILKRFLIVFDESGVMVIKHWRIHNTIQKDRYQITNYQEELNKLFIKNNKAYTLKNDEKNQCFQNGSNLDPKCIQNGSTDKIRLEKNIYVEFSEEKHDTSLDILANSSQTSLYDNNINDKNDSLRTNLDVNNTNDKNDSSRISLYDNVKKSNSRADLYVNGCDKNDSSQTNLDVNDVSVKKSSLRTDLQEKAEEVLKYLNAKAKRNFQNKKSSLKDIVARLKDNYTVEDCKNVIDLKVSKWLNDEKMRGYLVPQTLFRASHFENYLDEYEYEKTLNNQAIVTKKEKVIKVYDNQTGEEIEIISE